MQAGSFEEKMCLIKKHKIHKKIKNETGFIIDLHITIKIFDFFLQNPEKLQKSINYTVN